MTSYALGWLYKIGSSTGSKREHIGMVEHFYGPSHERAYVKTFCGLKGKINNREPGKTAGMIGEMIEARVNGPIADYLCRSCLYSWRRKRNG